MLGNGFLPMFTQGGAAANPWTGATWAVSGGNVYNTPTLGSELLTNGGFDTDTAWTKGAGWTISGGAGIATTVSSGVSIYQAGKLSVGAWFNQAWDITAFSSGSISAFGGGASVPPIFSAIGAALATFRATGTTAALIARSTPTNLSIDSVSIKQIALASAFATIAGASSNQAAAAKIATLTTGTQSGVVALLDSASNPQNFLIAYHNGTSVLLDKCVGGVYTNLITTTVAFVANAPIEIRRPSGNTFQLWYNGVQRGTDQTVADAGIINNTLYGLFSTYSSNTFSEFSLDGVVIPFNLPGA